MRTIVAAPLLAAHIRGVHPSLSWQNSGLSFPLAPSFLQYFCISSCREWQSTRISEVGTI